MSNRNKIKASSPKAMSYEGRLYKGRKLRIVRNIQGIGLNENDTVTFHGYDEHDDKILVRDFEGREGYIKMGYDAQFMFDNKREIEQELDILNGRIKLLILKLNYLKDKKQEELDEKAFRVWCIMNSLDEVNSRDEKESIILDLLEREDI